mmetsp:Transcript_21772/g.49870  ORF Transcript_21772/g.49870 Transcript_21772/m.49870 type:complete len:373 (-) Transcript_21772:38-1156(-)
MPFCTSYYCRFLHDWERGLPSRPSPSDVIAYRTPLLMRHFLTIGAAVVQESVANEGDALGGRVSLMELCEVSEPSPVCLADPVGRQRAALPRLSALRRMVQAVHRWDQLAHASGDSAVPRGVLARERGLPERVASAERGGVHVASGHVVCAHAQLHIARAPLAQRQLAEARGVVRQPEQPEHRAQVAVQHVRLEEHGVEGAARVECAARRRSAGREARAHDGVLRLELLGEAAAVVTPDLGALREVLLHRVAQVEKLVSEEAAGQRGGAVRAEQRERRLGLRGDRVLEHEVASVGPALEQLVRQRGAADRAVRAAEATVGEAAEVGEAPRVEKLTQREGDDGTRAVDRADEMDPTSGGVHGVREQEGAHRSA